jgi:hypothetical protein
MSRAPKPQTTTPTMPSTAPPSINLISRGIVSNLSEEDPNATVRGDPFMEAWEEFDATVKQLVAELSRVYKPQKDPWKHFEKAMSDTHVDEKAFKLALFASLQKSLEGLCADTGDTKFIRLRGSNAGFAMDVNRESDLGFPRQFALSTGINDQHACVVFAEKTAWKIKEMTAAVELKTLYSSCMEFNNETQPDFVKAHAPLGQGILYGMDVHHSLARTGQVAESIPVLVLAGVVPEPEPKKPLGLRCMLGTIHTPKKLGNAFSFVVDRCVPFSEGTDEFDKLAVALYLKTMCFGLKQALAIEDRKLQKPVSLCCSLPLTQLKLISSPIRDAARTAGGMKVCQGELFSLQTTTSTFMQDMRADFAEGLDFSRPSFAPVTFVEAGHDETVRCLVKVHCHSVHSSSILPSNSSAALSRVASERDDLKQEISKVLLAFVCITDIWLVTVMRDLSPRFELLLHDTFRPGPHLWTAFTQLVVNVLLPMADIDVVHTDIRFSPDDYTTYNILGSKHDDGSVDLRLIDLESLLIYDERTKNYTSHQYAVSAGHLSTTQAHVFLFWQVLWMGYVWSPRDARVPIEKAGIFIKKFKAQSEIPCFEEWVGQERMQTLVTLSQTFLGNDVKVAKEAVGKALATILSAFNQQSLIPFPSPRSHTPTMNVTIDLQVDR